jgi:hypothetical protein
VPRDAREIVVFLASPSDVLEERAAVRRAAQVVNDTVARKFGLRLHVEGWEQVQPALGRPQGLINPLVDECDVFVGLLDKRWGTPTGTHTSGFHEEFERILARQDEQPPPAAGLFFRDLAPDETRDAGPELLKVLAFQERIRDDHAALYRLYHDTSDLEIKAQGFLADLVSTAAAETIEPPQGTGPAAEPDSPPPPDDGDDAGPVEGGRAQLADALAGWADLAAGRKPAQAPDRDRLLAWALAVSADRDLLPVHAANRLYTRRAALDLVVGERQLWLRTLCSDMNRAGAHGTGRVIPGLYHFQDVAARDDDLATVAMTDTEECSRGALILLRALNARPDRLWNIRGGDEHGPADRWAVLLTAAATRTAAADYLLAVAGADDGPLLAEIGTVVADGSAGATARAVLAAASGDPGPAVDHLLAHPFSPPAWAVEATTQAVPGLPADRLAEVVEGRHRQADIRTAAFDRLVAHPDVTPAMLSGAFAAMLGSSDTRDHLLDTVQQNGTATFRAALRKAWEGLPQAERTSGASDRMAAATATPDELKAEAVPGYAGLHAFNALSHQRAPELAERARQVLRTQGREFADLPGLDDDSEHDSLKDFVAGRGREAALRILTALPTAEREPGDADLVRTEAAAAHWITHADALLALAQYAEPADIPALLDGAAASTVRSADSRALLEAACKVGGPTTALELAQSDDDQQAAAGAAYLASDLATDDETLTAFLHHKQATVRRPAIEAFLDRADTDRLRRLLDEYPQDPGGYFYDVMAALDWRLYAHPAGPASDASPAQDRRSHPISREHLGETPTSNGRGLIPAPRYRPD